MGYENIRPDPALDLPTHEDGYMDILDLTERNRTAASIHVSNNERKVYTRKNDDKS
jgi:hypothetical protein